jgi:hypothetical protein
VVSAPATQCGFPSGAFFTQPQLYSFKKA